MSAPLFEALLRHAAAGRAPFHTPGHKGNPQALPPELFRLDFTELPDTDSLYEASGPILAAEQEAARLFGAARTLFSAGGCTLCIQAMLRLAAPRGGKVIAGRTVHRSAVNAMALLGLTPVWVLPDGSAGPGLPGRIPAAGVEQALREHPHAACVYLTSPDYSGVLSDIPAIAAVCRAAGVPLLVDNAHGTHLRFTRRDLHPLSLGASMTACSAHKTLPVLTGGAWLQIADPAFAGGAKSAMALFGSTSPSYLTMASLDLAREWLAQHGKAAFAALEDRAASLAQLAAQRGFPQPRGLRDPTRLTLVTAENGLSGEEAAAHLRRRGVEPEHADASAVILLPSPWNREEDFARLARAIATLPAGNAPPPAPSLPPLPPAACSPREALLAPQEAVPPLEAVGRVAGEAACPCPPGVPLVMPGEKITAECAEFLSRSGFLSIKVLQ